MFAHCLLLCAALHVFTRPTSIVCSDWSVYMLPPLAIMPASCPLSMAGLPSTTLAAGCSPPLSPPLPPPIIPDFSMPKLFSLNTRAGRSYSLHCTALCNLSRSAVWSGGSVHCALLFLGGALECTDGPGHAIRPGVGTNTCLSSQFNEIITI